MKYPIKRSVTLNIAATLAIGIITVRMFAPRANTATSSLSKESLARDSPAERKKAIGIV